jgi:PAS domain-containing protein
MSGMDTDRRLRAALRPYQPRLLHDVLDSLDVAVVVLDETSQVLAGNVAASGALGVARGRRAADVPDDWPVEVLDEYGSAVDPLDYDAWRARAASGVCVAAQVRRDGGEPRWYDVAAFELGAADGDAVVCRWTDVTEVRELRRRATAATDRALRVAVDLVAAERRIADLEAQVERLQQR